MDASAPSPDPCPGPPELSPSESQISAISPIFTWSSKDLTTLSPPKFEHFGKVPLEVRLAIWEIVASKPRLVHWHFPGRGRNPAILAVNKESRNVALKKYTLCFGRTSNKRKYGFYFNMDVDFIFADYFVHKSNFIHNHETRVFQNFAKSLNVLGPDYTIRYWTKSIRRLCVADRYIEAGNEFVELWIKLNELCPGLEELIIIIGCKADPELCDLDSMMDFGMITDGCRIDEMRSSELWFRALGTAAERLRPGDLLRPKITVVTEEAYSSETLEPWQPWYLGR